MAQHDICMYECRGTMTDIDQHRPSDCLLMTQNCDSLNRALSLLTHTRPEGPLVMPSGRRWQCGQAVLEERR
jgi:hypothetical protein